MVLVPAARRAAPHVVAKPSVRRVQRCQFDWCMCPSRWYTLHQPAAIATVGHRVAAAYSRPEAPTTDGGSIAAAASSTNQATPLLDGATRADGNSGVPASDLGASTWAKDSAFDPPPQTNATCSGPCTGSNITETRGDREAKEGRAVGVCDWQTKGGRDQHDAHRGRC